MTLKKILYTAVAAVSLAGCSSQMTEPVTDGFVTVCNPMDLSYRFRPETNEVSRREAADPSVIRFKDRYFLFASKSGGYWHSKDLHQWQFIRSTEIPTEEYAPTAIVLNDAVYFLASSREKSTIYKSSDPMTGKWSVVSDLEIPVWDPAFHLEEATNELYLYWGCSNETPIYGVKLDPQHDFSFIGTPKELIHQQPELLGWEVPGDYNERKGVKPWIEGAWMNKHKGTYYLQYSGPGTEFKSYADGVYTSDNPLGPFQLATHNPMAYKPEGFAAGAGHGSTFTDDYGNYWHLGTITISGKHIFERRLGFYPSFFDEEGTLHATTKYGDWPVIVPDSKISTFEEIFPGWMLLSYGKKIMVSSEAEEQPAQNMADEDIRTYWAATSGKASEWAVMDLGKSYDVYALQINFAEHNTQVYDRKEGLFHQYLIEYSTDNREWIPLIDNSANQTDNTHVYQQLDNKVRCRYLRIKNRAVPDGNFAISDLRVFGKGDGSRPGQVKDLQLTRSAEDRRTLSLTWSPVEKAVGYNISYGTSRDKLYHNYMVYDTTMLTINSLNSNQTYYFSIEAFNENGIGDTALVKKAD